MKLIIITGATLGALFVLCCGIVAVGAIQHAVADRRDRKALLDRVRTQIIPAVADEPATAVHDTPELAADDDVYTDIESARTRLAAVAANLVFAEPAGGRCWSEITPLPVAPVDPWAESTEIATATIAAIGDPSVEIPIRAEVEVYVPESFDGFDAARELRRIKAAPTDPILAGALIARDPMMAFFLPVAVTESLPEFRSTWDRWRDDREKAPIVAEVIEPGWEHTGLTGAYPLVALRGAA